jgi:hypothetical protein
MKHVTKVMRLVRMKMDMIFRRKDTSYCEIADCCCFSNIAVFTLKCHVIRESRERQAHGPVDSL